MTLPASLPPGSTQDPERPHVWWYPQTGERLIVNFTPRPDPRDERLAELEQALYRIRTLAGDAPTLATVTDPATILETIYQLATDALAGAMPEPAPTGTVYEELSA